MDANNEYVDPGFMTFEQWQASRQRGDISERSGIDGEIGYHYADPCTFLNIYDDGTIGLIIGNQEWTAPGEDFEHLERILYDWISGEMGWRD